MLNTQGDAIVENATSLSRNGNDLHGVIATPTKSPGVAMLVRLPRSSETDHDEGRTPARIVGEQATGLYPGEPWGAVESRMAGDWRTVRGNSSLSWADVRDDAHAAWQVAKLQREDRLRDNAPVFLAA
jgi:hypothetical protein